MAWKMGTHLKHVYKGHDQPVHLLLPFGPHLISVDEGSCMKVWDIEAADLYTDINFEPDSFEVTAIMHPATYVNKILVGSRQGQLQLWNLQSRKYGLRFYPRKFRLICFISGKFTLFLAGAPLSQLSCKLLPWT